MWIFFLSLPVLLASAISASELSRNKGRRELYGWDEPKVTKK